MDTSEYTYGTWKNARFQLDPFPNNKELRLRLDDQGHAAWYCGDDGYRETLNYGDNILSVVDEATRQAVENLDFLIKWRLDYQAQRYPCGHKYEGVDVRPKFEGDNVHHITKSLRG